MIPSISMSAASKGGTLGVSWAYCLHLFKSVPKTVGETENNIPGHSYIAVKTEEEEGEICPCSCPTLGVQHFCSSQCIPVKRNHAVCLVAVN